MISRDRPISKESGEIEYACDSAYGLVAPADGDGDLLRTVNLYRPKNRQGATIKSDPLKVAFNWRTGRQTEIAR